MRVWLICVSLLLLLPAIGLAQEDEACSFEPVTPGGNNINQIGDAIYIGGRTAFRCSRGVSFVADSAVSALGMRMLIGNVIFTDTAKQIITDRLDYQESAGTVSAHNMTVVTDLKTGSVLRAPNGLLYTREAPGKQATLQVFSGRPHLTLLDSARVDTTNVDADAMTIIGQKYFTGRGNVVVTRGKLNATAAQTIFDDSLGIMRLWGLAAIKGENYDVKGDSIYSEVEGDQFRSVLVFRNASIVSENLDVRGIRLNVTFDSGAVNRLIAVGQRGDSTQVDRKPAVAVTPDFTLTADSIDAVAPKQKLEQVTAIGMAYGVRAPDSLDLKLPEAIRSDWLRGDTVIAFFIEAADSIKAKRAASDSTNDRVIDRLIAVGRVGRPATATYRMRAEGDTTTSNLEVGYIAARRITAVFKDGAVYDLDAQDQVQGLYLQPIRREATARGQSSSASRKP